MIEQLKEKVRLKLINHPQRYQHVIGVYETAIKLAMHHGEDLNKTAISALMHDYSKYDPIEAQTQHLDLEIIRKYAETPVIYHAFAAAMVLKTEYRIHDEDILDAVRYHVWGRKQMSTLEKIIFISDVCEPYRGFEDSNYIFELAMKDLDQATCHCMKTSIDYLLSKGLTPSKDQLETYEYYRR
ncbi:MAG: bis(5'-nucleosyl)-tetraphosphatase (symmetrical) YqeK [Acholeplasmataceae bacterium]|nr:bis(5'-nucleosyl)-tetraphosphatase (symmetrical) YqeK [Acholeplasmataceae bacterium]